MQNPYKQLDRFYKKIDSEVETARQKYRVKKDTKGLLSRQQFAPPASQQGEQDFTKRIANYVNTIRQKRMKLMEQKREEPLDV
jgi:hypothetical protein